MNKTDKNK